MKQTDIPFDGDDEEETAEERAWREERVAASERYFGSHEWADDVRDSLQSLANGMFNEPLKLAEYVAKLRPVSGWTLLNKPDGSYFKTLEEFCAHRQPWGLGMPWEEIRRKVNPALAILGVPGLDVATVESAQLQELLVPFRAKQAENEAARRSRARERSGQ
jgi:hypothetical protein